MVVPLGYRNMSARWVPRLLTEDQKGNRLCCVRKTRHDIEQRDFMGYFVTCDVGVSLHPGVYAGKDEVEKSWISDTAERKDSSFCCESSCNVFYGLQRHIAH